MAKPRIFVSSTYYDLKQVRSDLERFINDQGYDAVLNEKGNISYGSQEKLEEYCYKEIEQCDILVSIIGGRFGSQSNSDEYSVSNNELRKALESGKQVYIFIEIGVATEYRTYQVNKGVDGIKYASVDDVKIYKFLEEVYDLPKNNTIHNFSTAQDITYFLKEQWAGLFQRLLNEESKKKEENLINKLASTSETLDSLVQFLVGEKKNGESAVDNILRNNHPIFDDIKNTTKIPFRIFFENKDELGQILINQKFKLIRKNDMNYRDAYFSAYFPHDETKVLDISKSVFSPDKSFTLKTMTPQEWKSDYIQVRSSYTDDIPF